MDESFLSPEDEILEEELWEDSWEEELASEIDYVPEENQTSLPIGPKTLIFIAINLLLILTLVFGLNYVRHINQENRQMLTEKSVLYNAQITPLQNEKSQILADISTLEQKIQTAGAGYGTAVLLCTEPKIASINDIVVDVDALHAVGMVALSSDYFANPSQYLTIKQLTTLCRAGWSLCLTVNQDTDLPALYQQVIAARLPAPTAVYFPDVLCDTKWAAEVEALSIPTVIQRGSFAALRSEALSYLPAIGCYETEARNTLLESIQNSTCTVFTVGYTHSYELYSENNFLSMLRLMESYMMQQQLQLSTVAVGQQRMAERDRLIQERSIELAPQMDKLKLQLISVNAQINQLWKEFQS